MGMMGTSAECERGVMGRKERERGKSLRILFLPITPFAPLSLAQSLKYLHKVIARDWDELGGRIFGVLSK